MAKMKFKITWLFTLLPFLGIASNSIVGGASVGRVVIGTPDSKVSSLSFSNGTSQSSKWFLDVYATVYNETGDAVNLEDNVTLSCSHSPTWDGYSSAEFASITIEAPNGSTPNFTVKPITVRINFTNVRVGRTVELRCWGESVLEAVAPGENASIPQFTKETSLSPPVAFKIHHQGTVNICADRVIVPNMNDSGGTFFVELSDPVEAETSVTINCIVELYNTSDTPDLIKLKIDSVTITAGNRRIEMQYKRISGSGSVLVVCFGQSFRIINNVIYNDTQYTPGTSQGPPVPFKLDKGYVTIYPQSAVLKSSQMKLFLVLDASVTTDVIFTCRAETVKSPEDAVFIAENPYCQSIVDSVTARPFTNTTSGGATTTSPPTTPADRNQTGDWTLRKPRITFVVGGPQFAELNLDRATVIPAGGVQEIVVVTCCVPSGPTVNPKYDGKSTAALVLATLTPNIYVNITQATLPENEEKETPINNPAYVELAPCPCDLTKAACDTNCCCDTDCSETEKEMFTCISGLDGGFPAPLPRYICDTGGGVGRDDWYPFMCVHKENTAFLGYFFSNIPGLRDEATFKAKVKTVRPPYIYRETEERSKFTSIRSYKSGYDIKTGQMEQLTRTDTVITRKSFVLSLPQTSLLGQCVNMAPVRFLRDIDSECTTKVTKDLCNAMSPLSASVYAQSTEITNPPCPPAPVIIRAGRTDQITNIKAFYLCSEEATPYIRSIKRYSDLYNTTGKSMFRINVNTSDCAFDPDTQVFTCTENTAVPIAERITPPRCAWDDGYTPPPTPQYDNETGVCKNAVLDLNYNFTWRGNELLVLNATYVLADLPLEIERNDSSLSDYTPQLPQKEKSPPETTTATATTTDPTNVTTETPYVDYDLNLSVTVSKFPVVLSQKFKVGFWREFTVDNRTVNDTSRQDRYPRSGKIGYVTDRPVISGVPVLNTTDGSLSRIDTNVGLSLWSLAPGGLCAGAGQAPVNFRQNAVSSCVLRLGLSDLYQGCNDLRRQILHHQDAVMASSVISRNGDPNTNSLQHWIPILRENITAAIPPSTIPETTEGMTTESMPATTENTTTTPPFMFTTDNTTDTANDTTVQIDVETVGRCDNIPSGIHVDIMYAIAGAVNSRPVYEIVGAKISYAMSTWSLSCGGPSSAACLGKKSLVAAANNGSEEVQSFSLTSSVNFHLVPAKDQPAMTRYQEQHTPQLYKCQSDACWEELAYPFISGFQGDPIMYVRAVSLTSLIFVVAYFFVTRPWW